MWTWSAGTAVASGAPQSGTSVTVDTLSPRIMNAVYRGGSIYLVLTSDTNGDGASDVFWARIATNGGSPNAPTIADSGAIAVGPAWAFMPSINVNANGDAVICYSQSSSTQFPDMRYTMRLASDPPGSFQAPVIAKTSVGFYDSFVTTNPDRWGDFSACVVDPDDESFWVANEFVKSSSVNSSVWGTFIAHTAQALPTFTISGTVQTAGSTPISGVVMNGLPGPPSTDANGDYSGTVPQGFSGPAPPQNDEEIVSSSCRTPVPRRWRSRRWPWVFRRLPSATGTSATERRARAAWSPTPTGRLAGTRSH